MMMFRLVKNALVAILGENAESRFRVVGFLKQSKSADEFIGNNRLVQVYYSDGFFDRTSRMHGDKKHNMTFQINLFASAPAKGDLSVLENPAANYTQKAAALLAVQEAASVADTQLDELIDAVFMILTNTKNEKLGLGLDSISNRWIEQIQKDTLVEYGDMVMKTANIKYMCSACETVTGDIGNEPDTVIINSNIGIDDTDTGAGVLNEN